ncbi:unnamed protein product [Sphagnum balticum]
MPSVHSPIEPSAREQKHLSQSWIPERIKVLMSHQLAKVKRLTAVVKLAKPILCSKERIRFDEHSATVDNTLMSSSIDVIRPATMEEQSHNCTDGDSDYGDAFGHYHFNEVAETSLGVPEVWNNSCKMIISRKSNPSLSARSYIESNSSKKTFLLDILSFWRAISRVNRCRQKSSEDDVNDCLALVEKMCDPNFDQDWPSCILQLF